jgi:hypothetical protein
MKHVFLILAQKTQKPPRRPKLYCVIFCSVSDNLNLAMEGCVTQHEQMTELTTGVFVPTDESLRIARALFMTNLLPESFGGEMNQAARGLLLFLEGRGNEVGRYARRRLTREKLLEEDGQVDVLVREVARAAILQRPDGEIELVSPFKDASLMQKIKQVAFEFDQRAALANLARWRALSGKMLDGSEIEDMPKSRRALKELQSWASLGQWDNFRELLLICAGQRSNEFATFTDKNGKLFETFLPGLVDDEGGLTNDAKAIVANSVRKKDGQFQVINPFADPKTSNVANEELFAPLDKKAARER